MAKSSNNCSAKVILDSISPNGKRLITIEARYWRAIHAEVMTHRDRARNAASSRAIPFYREIKCTECSKNPHDVCSACGDNGTVVVPNCTYSFIENDPFIPEFIGAEQKGMQSGRELIDSERDKAVDLIDDMRRYCLDKCKQLYGIGVHKSIINRYLEPWSYITVLMTATEWKNFFRLRIHPKAEKHFDKVARMMKDAIDASTPNLLQPGQWHMPYIRPEDDQLIKDYIGPEANSLQILRMKKKVSAARCARLSYLTHDGEVNLQQDMRIFDTLIHPKIEQDRDDDVIHSSPLEHVASPLLGRSGPYDGWFQFRKEFPNENVAG